MIVAQGAKGSEPRPVMITLWDRLVEHDGPFRFRLPGPLTPAEVVERLEAGGEPGSLGLPPEDVLAALAWAGLGPPGSLGPALIQQPPKRPRLAPALAEPALVALLPRAHRGRVLALSAGLLLIHDFWSASHAAAQTAEDQGERDFSAYWHGIAHRREPDASNAAYWFRRVGRHPLLATLGELARPILEEAGDERWVSRLLEGGSWNPMAMIEFATGADRSAHQEALLRRLQRLEMQLLLDATATAAMGDSA